MRLFYQKKYQYTVTDVSFNYLKAFEEIQKEFYYVALDVESEKKRPESEINLNYEHIEISQERFTIPETLF